MDLLDQVAGTNPMLFMLDRGLAVLRLRGRRGDGVRTLGPVAFGCNGYGEELARKVGKGECIAFRTDQAKRLDVRGLLEDASDAELTGP